MVKFEEKSQCEKAWKAKSGLKGTKIILCEDLPSSMIDNRKVLLPYFHAARRSEKVKKCSLQRDCLVIDSQKYYANDIDKIPQDLAPHTPYERQMTTTEGTAFFGKRSFMSNFFPCQFKENHITFDNVEKYYQYKKALYFQDTLSAEQILKAKTPRKAKSLGHQIKHFDEDMWRTVQRQTMFTGCALKFKQNPQLTMLLKTTKGLIVEANPHEKFFSCGLSISDKKIEDYSQWPGENALGQILCDLRESL